MSQQHHLHQCLLNGTGGGGGGGGQLPNSQTSASMTNSYQQTSCQTGPLQNSSDTGGNKIYPNKNRICRDFVRGNCRRKSCRYPHVLSPDLIVFCHDYQNSNCPRANCKFLHYTLQEEEYYRKFGEFPEFEGPPPNGCGLVELPGGGISTPSLQSMPPPPAPSIIAMQKQTKDYLPPFRHHHHGGGGDPYLGSGPGMNVIGNRFDLPPPNGWTNQDQMYQSNDRSVVQFHHCDEFQRNGTGVLKRSARDSIEATSKRFRDENERVDVMQVIRRFEEEQSILRRRVETNEIKIAELRASNEYLMAQVRLNNHQQCSTVVNPVTVTQTSTQPQPQQTGPTVISGVSIAPVLVQATPIVSIATPQTQQITAVNSAAPIAIATASTSQGQQQIAIAAQQNSQTMQTTHAQQILGTSQITLGPALAPAPSMGLTINTSQALAMSNATPQPIISYPIMTHSILPH